MQTITHEYNGHHYIITTDDDFKYTHASIHRKEEIQLANGEVRKIYPAMVRYTFDKNVALIGIDELLREVIDYKIRNEVYLTKDDLHLLLKK